MPRYESGRRCFQQASSHANMGPHRRGLGSLFAIPAPPDPNCRKCSFNPTLFSPLKTILISLSRTPSHAAMTPKRFSPWLNGLHAAPDTGLRDGSQPKN
jgi:hypothetical protein